MRPSTLVDQQWRCQRFPACLSGVSTNEGSGRVFEL